MKWIRNAVITLLRAAVRSELSAQRESTLKEVRELCSEMTDVLEQFSAVMRREAARRARDVKAALKESPQQPRATNGHALDGLRGPERKAALRAMLRHGGLPQHALPTLEPDEEMS